MNVFLVLLSGFVILAGFGSGYGAVGAAGLIMLALTLAVDSAASRLERAGKALEKAIGALETQARWLNEHTAALDGRERPESEMEAVTGLEAPPTNHQQEKSE